jgi:hypothetical protein
MTRMPHTQLFDLTDHAHFTCGPTGVDLRLFWRQPTRYEIALIKKAPLRLGLAVVQHCAFMLYAWRNGPYGDAPYVAGVTAAHSPQLEPRASVTVSLIDTVTARTVLRRHGTIADPLSTALADVLDDCQVPATPRFPSYVRQINAVYRRMSLARLLATGVWVNVTFD